MSEPDTHPSKTNSASLLEAVEKTNPDVDDFLFELREKTKRQIEENKLERENLRDYIEENKVATSISKKLANKRLNAEVLYHPLVDVYGRGLTFFSLLS